MFVPTPILDVTKIVTRRVCCPRLIAIMMILSQFAQPSHQPRVDLYALELRTPSESLNSDPMAVNSVVLLCNWNACVFHAKHTHTLTLNTIVCEMIIVTGMFHPALSFLSATQRMARHFLLLFIIVLSGLVCSESTAVHRGTPKHKCGFTKFSRSGHVNLLIYQSI